MSTQLVTGDRMPPIEAKDLEGESTDLTVVAAGRWAVVLFYRGDW